MREHRFSSGQCGVQGKEKGKPKISNLRFDTDNYGYIQTGGLMRYLKHLSRLSLLPFILLLAACSGFGEVTSNRTTCTLDANASGVIETTSNIVNLTVVSRDSNDLKAEYRAGNAFNDVMDVISHGSSVNPTWESL
jgi:hypothetical protein